VLFLSALQIYPAYSRGYVLEDGESAFLFEKGGLAAALSLVRALFNDDPSRLRRLADNACTRNETSIDMTACAPALVDAITVRPAVAVGA
jgi:hypothetical protein